MHNFAKILLILVFFLCFSCSLQASSLWDQTSWTGGIGTSTESQFSSGENMNTAEGKLALSDVSNWLDPLWLYRKKILFSNSRGDVLHNFPVFLSLNENNFDFTKIRSDCRDLRLTDADGRSPLSYMIETCSPSSNQITIWVNVPEILATNTDSIYLYFGNRTAIDSQDPYHIWPASSGWTRVLLMNQFFFTDRVLEGAAPTRVGGIEESQVENTNTGRGLRLDGLNDYVSFDDPYRTTSTNRSLKYDGGPLTITAVVKPALTETGGVIISKPWNAQGQYNYVLSINEQRHVYFQITGGIFPLGTESYSESSSLVTERTVTPGNTIAITATVTPTGIMKVYVNGEEWGSTPITITHWPPDFPPSYSDRHLPLTIGTLYPYGDTWTGRADFSFQGIIDDISLSHVTRSPAWIEASARQIIDPERWVSFGATEMSFVDHASLISNIFCTDHEGTNWESADFHSNGQGTITMKLRTSNSLTSMNTDFSECNPIHPGLSLIGNDCVHSGDLCAQYMISMASNGDRPEVTRVTVTYQNATTPETPTSTPTTPAPSPIIVQPVIERVVSPPESRSIPIELGSLLISESNGSTQLRQDQNTDETYTIALDRRPTSNVTVTIISDSLLLLSPTSLSFTPENWDSPQTINVRMVDKTIQELQADILIHIQQRTTSADPQFNGTSSLLTVLGQPSSIVSVVTGSNSTTAGDTSTSANGHSGGCSLMPEPEVIEIDFLNIPKPFE